MYPLPVGSTCLHYSEGLIHFLEMAVNAGEKVESLDCGSKSSRCL